MDLEKMMSKMQSVEEEPLISRIRFTPVHKIAYILDAEGRTGDLAAMMGVRSVEPVEENLRKLVLVENIHSLGLEKDYDLGKGLKDLCIEVSCDYHYAFCTNFQEWYEQEKELKKTKETRPGIPLQGMLAGASVPSLIAATKIAKNFTTIPDLVGEARDVQGLRYMMGVDTYLGVIKDAALKDKITEYIQEGHTLNYVFFCSVEGLQADFLKYLKIID